MDAFSQRRIVPSHPVTIPPIGEAEPVALPLIPEGWPLLYAEVFFSELSCSFIDCHFFTLAIHRRKVR
jgi:hypothetical protein